MPPTWERDLDFYLVLIDDKPASIVLDLAAAGEVPLESHPVRLSVRVPLLRPREDGLRDPDELDELSAVEDLFTERLAAEIDAIFAGRVIHDGELTMYFYVPDEHRARLEDLPSLTGPAPGDYEPAWGVSDDPGWECYLEFLTPDPYSHQTILNRRLVKVFEDKGDQVDTPREIDHFAYFESQDQAEEASVALRTAGFEVDDLDPPDEDGEPWGLQFHRVDAVGGGRADEFCAEILDIVLPLEGDYDGWGAPMVQPEVN